MSLVGTEGDVVPCVAEERSWIRWRRAGGRRSGQTHEIARVWARVQVCVCVCVVSCRVVSYVSCRVGM